MNQLYSIVRGLHVDQPYDVTHNKLFHVVYPEVGVLSSGRDFLLVSSDFAAVLYIKSFLPSKVMSYPQCSCSQLPNITCDYNLYISFSHSGNAIYSDSAEGDLIIVFLLIIDAIDVSLAVIK